MVVYMRPPMKSKEEFEYTFRSYQYKGYAVCMNEMWKFQNWLHNKFPNLVPKTSKFYVELEVARIGKRKVIQQYDLDGFDSLDSVIDYLTKLEKSK